MPGFKSYIMHVLHYYIYMTHSIKYHKTFIADRYIPYITKYDCLKSSNSYQFIMYWLIENVKSLVYYAQKWLNMLDEFIV